MYAKPVQVIGVSLATKPYARTPDSSGVWPYAGRFFFMEDRQRHKIAKQDFTIPFPAPHTA